MKEKVLYEYIILFYDNISDRILLQIDMHIHCLKHVKGNDFSVCLNQNSTKHVQHVHF